MVISIPVSEETVSKVAALLDTIERQGGVSKHHFWFVTNRTDGLVTRAETFAARAGKTAASARVIVAEGRALLPDNDGIYTTVKRALATLGDVKILWLDPVDLPATAASFDLLETATAQFPAASVFCGFRGPDYEPQGPVIFSAYGVSRSQTYRKMVLSKDRGWRSLFTFLYQQSVCLPVLDPSSKVALFTRQGGVPAKAVESVAEQETAEDGGEDSSDEEASDEEAPSDAPSQKPATASRASATRFPFK